MKNTFYSIILSAALMLLALLSGCADKLQPEITPVENGSYLLTVTAQKADALTKALGKNGDTIDATWESGETVDVYKGENKVGTLTANGFGTTTTTLSGEVDNTVQPGDNLTLKFKSPDYNNQDGTLASIAANCDYATATVEVLSVDNNIITPKTSSVSFTNQQAIVEFILKPYYYRVPKTISIQYGQHQVAFSLADSFDFTYEYPSWSEVKSFFAAIPGDSGKDITIFADCYDESKNNKAYYFNKTNVTLENGKYYHITITNLTDAAPYTPLTFEAANDGTKVRFTEGTDISFGNHVEYRKNNGNWTAYRSGDDISLDKGETVSFRGDLPKYRDRLTTEYTGSNFSCDKDCYVYGNVMSLIYPTDFATNKSLTQKYAFSQLFKGNEHILNHPGSTSEHEYKLITLPATTLTDYCYSELFSGCTGLTMMSFSSAQEMEIGCYQEMFNGCSNLETTIMYPATELAESCYQEMFKGCSKLHGSPTLANSTAQLAPWCYYGMFEDCTSLYGIPDNYLPRTSLEGAKYCYARMFKGCTQLNVNSNSLPATTLSEKCYYQMFMGCTNLSIKLTLPAGDPQGQGALAESCYESMFEGCTGLYLDKAPDLPATTLAKSCYRKMFEGCTHIYYAPDLPATTLAISCYERMFHGCSYLAESPVLPAPTLESGCYNEMFENCTNLSKITCLATVINDDSCTTNWVNNVNSAGTFYKSSSISEEDWKTSSYWTVSRIPRYWDVTDYSVTQ